MGGLNHAEQLARGELEALTRILDALATESAVDKLLGHVLGTMARQLEARTVSLWLLDSQCPSPVSHLVFRDGRLLPPGDGRFGATTQRPRWTDHPITREILRSRKPVLCCAVEPDPRRVGGLHPAGGPRTGTVLTVPLFVAKQVIGLISLLGTRRRGYRRGEVEFAQTLAHQATLVIQLARLAERSRTAAVIEERNRLARDIHDTLAQGFTGVIIQLEAAEDALTRHAITAARRRLVQARNLARHSLGEARRSVLALRPEALEHGNFAGALRQLLARITRGTPLQASLRVFGRPRPIPPRWEENLLHIGQEALTNTLKHARASKFCVHLSYRSHGVRLVLRDDGRGFDAARRNRGLGLLGMRERVQAIGGQLRILRPARRGTSILVVASARPSPARSLL